MGIRYKIKYQNPFVELRSVGLADSREAAEATIKILQSMNQEENESYEIEEFDDPAYTPTEDITPEFAEQPITQESLDYRIAQTDAKDLNDATTKNQRLLICTACEFNKPLMGFDKCSECNCFVYLKTRIKSSVCPKGKW